MVLGVASSGLHSNGYSLVRKVVFDIAGLEVDDHVEELGTTVGEALLTPTRIYVRPVRSVLGHYRVKSVVHGIAHITGGGLRENLERDPARRASRSSIDRGSWPCRRSSPGCSGWARSTQAEMDRVFNMGIGLVLVVSPSTPRASSTSWPTADWRAGRSAACRKARAGSCGPSELDQYTHSWAAAANASRFSTGVSKKWSEAEQDVAAVAAEALEQPVDLGADLLGRARGEDVELVHAADHGHACRRRPRGPWPAR